ncbi:serine/threonine-protein kinase [Streptomyces gilvosporeus]|uniref:non-specific serine/threonine protein kinase n=1 Tax=Streptomyces gilvosporeus TaxID=553510 RepID=A0A1V0U3N0_9ACTN|nr:serine/threonine-protein kinase [Streptomyces gilvosporeus]ARF59542.1 serine/threonine protein kinase [Streptomyces gilvosporeus]
MDGKEGRLLAGRYRLADVLGRGGMGTVWRARDEVLGRTVAVKELRFPGGVEEDEKRRLITRTLREAKAIARIRNNGAVTVYDVVDEDDRPWIVMELVEGRSLAELVRDDGPLAPRRAAEVGLAILDVLRAAHSEGILHRDVKPSNVLMSDDGRVVLTDFGIAQVEGDPSVTSTGMLVGAPSYISPERARGHKPGPPADMWSLGGLLYACVEGHPPYDKGSAIATLTAVMTEPVEPPKSAGALEDVIYGLLVKDPAGRLDDAGARALLLEVVHGPQETEPEPPADATRAMALPTVPGERTAKPRATKPKAPAKQSAKTAAKAAPKAKEPRKPKEKAAGAAGAGAGAGTGGKAGAAAKPAAAGSGSAAGASSSSGSSAASSSSSASGAGAAAASEKSAARPGNKPATRKPAGSGRTDASDAASASASGTRTAADDRPAARPGFDADTAKDRVRGALQSVRNAAAAARSESRPGDGERPVPRASVTDVVPRRTLIIAAVVVVLLVLGTILAIALSGGDTANGADAAKNGKARHSARLKDAKGTPDASTGDPGDDQSGQSGAQSPGPGAGDGKGGDQGGANGGGKDGGKGGKALPAGFAPVSNGRFHFTAAMPDGFTQTGTAGEGSGAIYSSGGGFPRIQIDYNAKPGTDAAASWRDLERTVSRSTPGYHLLGIKTVQWRGYPTVADWSFTYKKDGQTLRVLDRGFRADDQHGYAIMITCRADAWSDKECRQLRDTAFRTFAVKD